METVQIVLDKKLLRAADQAARRTKRNRSALVRDALRSTCDD
jgi:metal-responsive CopG/Arc/MetJ family transcriptional regulator